MPFVSLSLTLAHDHADAFGDALLEAGALSVSVEDADAGTASEKPIFGEPGATSGIWQLCTMTALFPAHTDAREIARNAASLLGFELSTLVVSEQEDLDWVAQNRAQFVPIEITPELFIVPTWHEPSNLNATNIRLDPGAAFGTGSHPTTKLCLQWLCSQGLDGKRVLDYGTGSGILAIAAVLRGARETLGVDIDPQAIDAARANALQNNVDITFATTDTTLHYIADVTLANILANPLKVLAPLLAAHTHPGGSLVLAGLLDHQAEEIIAIYQPWFALEVWQRMEGWSCLAGTKKTATAKKTATR